MSRSAFPASTQRRHPLVRDKDYLLTQDRLIFNVLGYDHAADSAVCGLKYVGGEKWLAGYPEALQLLQRRYPHYVDQLIRVPLDQVAAIYRSEERLPQLRDSSPTGLLAAAVELADLFAGALDLPQEAFGLTDSLLWGEGHADSDIDLVIYGTPNCEAWLNSAARLFALPDIQPIAAEYVQRPPTLSDAAFAQLCQRKRNQGYYRGTRFSVRGVRRWQEIPTRLPLAAGEPAERELTIADNRQSLFYPVIYNTREDVDIVAFQIGYEAAFAPGDRVRAQGAQLDERTILIGSLYGRDESLTLIPAA